MLPSMGLVYSLWTLLILFGSSVVSLDPIGTTSTPTTPISTSTSPASPNATTEANQSTTPLLTTTTHRPPHRHSKYLVQTSTCNITAQPVFPNDITNIYRPYSSKVYPCPRPTIADQIRAINYTFVSIPPTLKNCTAWEITKTENRRDFTFQFLTAINASASRITEIPNGENVLIRCGRGVERVIQLVPKRQPKKWADVEVPKVKNSHPVNVLILGLDSISRLNFHRHLPQTVRFLKRHRFQAFYGHHKIGRNTAPNVFAMMLGHNYSIINPMIAANNTNGTEYLDALPWIMKQYSAAGYLTTYSEDFSNYGLFTYGFSGFKGPYPTDYHARPTSVYVTRKMRFPGCYGGKMEMEIYWPHQLQQLSAFRSRGQHYLSWSHMAYFTHDHLNHAQYVDRPLRRMLQAIFAAGHQNNTIMVLYSDHSFRILNVRELQLSTMYHEVRLPVLYIYVPEGLVLEDGHGRRLNGTEIRKAMAANSHRLTSHFDIYSILQHVLYGVPQRSDFGISLFTPVPENRTCTQAGIPLEYCLCTSTTRFPSNSTFARQLGSFVLEHINQQVKWNGGSRQCANLSLDTVLDIKSVQGEDISREDDLLGDLERQTVILSMVVSARPGGAIFETALKTTVFGGAPIGSQIVGEIERKDGYRKEGRCVAGKVALERFCICKERKKKRKSGLKKKLAKELKKMLLRG